MNRTTRIIPTLSVASTLGAALFAAPAHAGSHQEAWTTMDVTTVVRGNTVELSYSDHGEQYAMTDGGKTLTSNESMGYEIDYGDGSTPEAANGGGGATCKQSGPVKPFRSGPVKLSHTYSKPGTYVITTTSHFCGTEPDSWSGQGYTVTVGKNGVTSTKPAPTTSGTSAVSAAAHIRYTVKGNTATLTPYVSGTQHRFVMEGKEVDSVLPENFDVALPKGAVAGGGGNWAGDGPSSTCTTKGSVPLSTEPLSVKPLTVTFPGPGTYPVTLKAGVCTSQGTVTKTVNITIPAAGSTGSNGSTTGSAPTDSIPAGEATPDGSAPEGGTSAPAPAASKGPHVDTDRDGGSNDVLWGAAGLAGVAAIGGSIVVARRRTN